MPEVTVHGIRYCKKCLSTVLEKESTCFRCGGRLFALAPIPIDLSDVADEGPHPWDVHHFDRDEVYGSI